MTEAAPSCRSRAVIALDEPERVLDELLDHMTEHATVIRTDDGARLESPFATVEILRLSDTILVDVVAPTPEILGMVRHFIAEHVFEFAGEGARIDWSGADAAERLPPQFRKVSVLRVIDLTPRMRRLVFACDRPEIYLGDVGYHIRLLLPPRGRVPCWPRQRPDGRLDWPAGEDALVSRVYTIREVDAAVGTISVDFVLHEGGLSPGSDFARHARPGDVAGLMGPGGDGCPVAGRVLLLGDAAALPAIARMVSELPAHAEITAVIEVACAAEIQPLRGTAPVRAVWLCRDEEQAAPGISLLEGALVARLENGSPGSDLADVDFIWAGCEKAVAGRIREMLHTRFPDRKKDCRIYAYWQDEAARPV